MRACGCKDAIGIGIEIGVHKRRIDSRAIGFPKTGRSIEISCVEVDVTGGDAKASGRGGSIRSWRHSDLRYVSRCAIGEIESWAANPLRDVTQAISQRQECWTTHRKVLWLEHGERPGGGAIGAIDIRVACVVRRVNAKEAEVVDFDNVTDIPSGGGRRDGDDEVGSRISAIARPQFERRRVGPAADEKQELPVDRCEKLRRGIRRSRDDVFDNLSARGGSVALPKFPTMFEIEVGEIEQSSALHKTGEARQCVGAGTWSDRFNRSGSSGTSIGAPQAVPARRIVSQEVKRSVINDVGVNVRRLSVGIDVLDERRAGKKYATLKWLKISGVLLAP